jgi:hypothetical protein
VARRSGSGSTPLRDYRLFWECDACEVACEHAGSAFSLILEDKLSLGLAAPPPDRVPIGSLSEEELLEQVLSEREERAASQRMKLISREPEEAAARLFDQAGALWRSCCRSWVKRRVERSCSSPSGPPCWA